MQGRIAGVASTDNANICARLRELMLYLERAIGTNQRRLVKNRVLPKISQLFHVFQFHESALAGHIPDDSEINRHFLQALVKIIQDEQGQPCFGKFLAKLLLPAGGRLVCSEVGRVEIYLDDAGVIFYDQSSAGPALAKQAPQQQNENLAAETCFVFYGYGQPACLKSDQAGNDARNEARCLNIHEQPGIVDSMKGATAASDRIEKRNFRAEELLFTFGSSIAWIIVFMGFCLTHASIDGAGDEKVTCAVMKRALNRALNNDEVTFVPRNNELIAQVAPR